MTRGMKASERQERRYDSRITKSPRLQRVMLRSNVSCDVRISIDYNNENRQGLPRRCAPRNDGKRYGSVTVGRNYPALRFPNNKKSPVTTRHAEEQRSCDVSIPVFSLCRTEILTSGLAALLRMTPWDEGTDGCGTVAMTRGSGIWVVVRQLE